MAQKQIPTPAKVISVLYFIGAIYAVASSGAVEGITLKVTIDFISSLSKIINPLGLSGAVSIIVALVALGLIILELLVARALWNGKNWARLLLIAFSITGVLIGIYLLTQRNVAENILQIFDFEAFTTILINGLILGYLLLSKKVKQTFE